MRRSSPVFSLAALSMLGVHCSTQPPAGPPPRIANTTPLPTASQPPPVPTTPKSAGFENPGGMWMPSQMGDHAAKLKELGLGFDPAKLADPTSSVLGAVVSLGGCSASFVSAEGLVITNHHCVQGALQFNATPEQNLIKNGFLAATKADEKSAGPSARVFVTQSAKDVTSTVLEGLESIKGDRDRYKKIEERTKTLVASCEKDRPGTRCSVAKFFEGAQYQLIEQLEIRDVRLVYAPSSGVGNYGGEIDNWRWPRHTGDFSFYRAYVGKDGKPADYSPDNVPYHPPHVLKVSTKGLTPGDLVFVAGYPGRTSRLKTAAQVSEAVDWWYPRRIKFFEEYLDMIAKLSEGKPDIAIKANNLTRGFNNALTNSRGQVEGLTKGGLAAERSRREKELRAWIDGDAARKAKWGGALERMDKIQDEQAKTRDKDAALNEIVTIPRLLAAATTIVRLAEERAKPDAQRDPDYQERNWSRLEQSTLTMQKQYDRTLDKALLKLAFQRAAKLPKAQRPEILIAIAGKSDPTDAVLDKAIDALYASTKIEDEKVRVDLLKNGTTASLRASKDPLIALALATRPTLKANEERDEGIAGIMAIERPRYLAAMREWMKGALAPDANSTLRITYGTVRGYKPKPDAPMYAPFTNVSELLKKNTGKDPFDAPARLVTAANERHFGPYLAPSLNDLPVDFLADLDITGGNSGSATMNANGELVGLVFDGNYESMASDWLFQPPITRSIHVDIRYALWIMDTVDKADHLLTEMGVTPALP